MFLIVPYRFLRQPGNQRTRQLIPLYHIQLSGGLHLSIRSSMTAPTADLIVIGRIATRGATGLTSQATVPEIRGTESIQEAKVGIGNINASSLCLTSPRLAATSSRCPRRC